MKILRLHVSGSPTATAKRSSRTAASSIQPLNTSQHIINIEQLYLKATCMYHQQQYSSYLSCLLLAMVFRWAMKPELFQLSFISQANV